MNQGITDYYKDLLCSIFNVEFSKGVKGATGFICVYDTKENDRLVAIFNTSKTCAKFLHTTSRTVDSSICKGYLRFRRYRLERISRKEIENE